MNPLEMTTVTPSAAPSILIVDDRIENLIAIEAVVEPLGYETLKAQSGNEALRMSIENQVNLILMDVQMSDMDGFETASLLKSISSTRHIPIIFVTAISKKNKSVLRGYEAGGVDYVFKPIDEKVLQNKINMFIGVDQHKEKITTENEKLRMQLHELKQPSQETEEENRHPSQSRQLAEMGSWAYDLDTETIRVSDDCRRLADTVQAAGRRLIKDFSRPQSIIGVLPDITKFRATESQLELANKILENSGEGVVISNSTGEIEWCNNSFLALLGYCGNDVLGAPMSRFLSGAEKELLDLQIDEELIRDGKWQGEIWVREASGETIPTRLTLISASDQYTGEEKRIAIYSNLGEIRKSEDSARYWVNHDPMTKLPNRYLLIDRMTQACDMARRSGHMVGLLYIDIGRFHQVNDSLGYSVGDRVLKLFADKMTNLIGDAASCYRVNGDEFAVLVPDVVGPEALLPFAKLIESIFNLPFRIDGHELQLMARIGIAAFPSDVSEALDLVEAGALAASSISNQPMGNSCFYEAQMNERAKARLERERELRKALKSNEFTLVYQPKVNLKTGSVCGVEALVRWTSPTLGVVSPEDFIPAAEASGLIIPLGNWIFKEAIAQAAAWRRAGNSMPVAVNLSALQIRDENLISTIRCQLQEFDLPGEFLEVEVTENMMMEDMEACVRLLHQLRELNARVSVDDFGTGYSSLAYLSSMPLDTLKIDRTFISKMTSSVQDTHIIRAILSLGQQLDLNIVAEGVETSEQMQALIQYQCDSVQGYLFARPVAPAQIGPELFDSILNKVYELNFQQNSDRALECK